MLGKLYTKFAIPFSIFTPKGLLSAPRKTEVKYSVGLVLLHCVTKKSLVLSAIPIDSGNWRPIKQSLMRRFFVSRLEEIFWSFEVLAISTFSYLVIIC